MNILRGSRPDTLTSQTSLPAEIKIGVVGPMTGEAAALGHYMRNGIALAQEELAAAGGLTVRGSVIPVSIIQEDNAGTPELTAAAYRKLIDQDQVLAIVGPDISQCMIAAGPIAQTARIPAIGTTTTNQKVTQIGDYLFRACYTDPYQGQAAARYALEYLQARTACVLYNKTDDFAAGLTHSFLTAFTAGGGQVLKTESYQGGSKHYASQLAQIKAAQADLLFLPNNFLDLGQKVLQSREMGITARIIGGDPFDTPEIVAEAGVANIEGVTFIAPFSAESAYPAAQAYVSRYQARFQTQPNANSVLAYEALKIVLRAIQDAGQINGSGIRNAMARITDLELPTGRTSFDVNRNPVKGAVVLAYRNGRPTFVQALQP